LNPQYGLWKRYGGKWKTYDEVPFFYKDFDDISAECLQKLDADYSKVRNAIRKHFPDRPFKYMLNYLDLERLVYQTDSVDIKSSFTESVTLGLIKTPVMHLENGEYMIDKHVSIFGLCSKIVASNGPNQVCLSFGNTVSLLHGRYPLRVAHYQVDCRTAG